MVKRKLVRLITLRHSLLTLFSHSIVEIHRELGNGITENAEKDMTAKFSTTKNGKRAWFKTAAYVCSRLKEDVEALEKVRSILKASVKELEDLLASRHHDSIGGSVLFGIWIREKIKEVIPEADPCAGMTDVQIHSQLLQGCYTLLCHEWETANQVKAALAMRKMNGGRGATMAGEFKQVLEDLQSSLHDKYRIAKGVKLTKTQLKNAAACNMMDKKLSIEFDWFE